MDNLEKYFKEHKKEFDVEFVSKHQVWENLEQKIAPAKVIPLWKNRWIQLAAAACLIGILAIPLFRARNDEALTICSINGVSKEFCMQVSNYETSIQSKLSGLDSTSLTIPQEVEEEVSIDTPMKAVLLNELKRNPDNPRIKDAILKYYKAKLELIERIEEVLRKQEKSIKNENTHNDIG